MDEKFRPLTIADYLLSTTYPLVKDPKVLIGVLNNIGHAHDAFIEKVIKQKGLFQPSTHKGAFEQFKHLVGEELSSEELRSMRIIYELREEHKISPVEFVRKQRLIICSSDYAMKTLTHSTLKEHLRHAKLIAKKLLV